MYNVSRSSTSPTICGGKLFSLRVIGILPTYLAYINYNSDNTFEFYLTCIQKNGNGKLIDYYGGKSRRRVAVNSYTLVTQRAVIRLAF